MVWLVVRVVPQNLDRSVIQENLITCFFAHSWLQIAINFSRSVCVFSNHRFNFSERFLDDQRLYRKSNLSIKSNTFNSKVSINSWNYILPPSLPPIVSKSLVGQQPVGTLPNHSFLIWLLKLFYFNVTQLVRKFYSGTLTCQMYFKYSICSSLG